MSASSFVYKFGLALGAFLSISTTSQATPVRVQDNFIGGKATNPNHANIDVIGDLKFFDIKHVDIEKKSDTLGNFLSLSISSSYFDNVGQWGTQFGDVFLSSDGWSPHGSAPYLNDDASNGEAWEYALKFDRHGEAYVNNGEVKSMLGQSGTVSLVALNSPSDIELSGAASDHRANQEFKVADSANLPVLNSGVWNILEGANGYHLLQLSIRLTGTALDHSSILGFHFGFSCGNDVIEGKYHVPGTEVPEPSSLALLLSGSLGMAFRRRKQANR